MSNIAIRHVEIIRKTLMKSVTMAIMKAVMDVLKGAFKLSKITNVLQLGNVINSVEMECLKEMIQRLGNLMEHSLNNAMMATI
jgi:hypothetical protein